MCTEFGSVVEMEWVRNSSCFECLGTRIVVLEALLMVDFVGKVLMFVTITTAVEIRLCFEMVVVFVMLRAVFVVIAMAAVVMIILLLKELFFSLVGLTCTWR